ncbi:hypothetical protein [Loktanella sp. S4079]|uniref:hypothetical protein n=1 Tax=Loktanella sp. S4079 TaxID=579483 RepID=UPI0005FA71EA|nr:hypothetical protein [Loktanella sp. S4079]KJZ17983.1 hypothetical protein TW80_15935 [Loktanella sp. S4079]
MADLPPVGALWIGGSLTWLEQLCLKSFVDQGHQTILYTYGEVQGIPEGVEVRDGSTILSTDNFVTHARSGSVALFSDLFRFHLIANEPEIIYVDTDVYSVKPFPGNESHVFGYERYSEERQRGRINGAVLKLPQDSPALQALLEFTKDEYPIPEWLPPRHLKPIQERAEQGNPMHVSEMLWGIWGPVGLTAFLHQSGEYKYARETDVYYPLPFPDRRFMTQRPRKVLSLITQDTVCIHLWAPIKRFCAKRFEGVPPKNSFLDTRLALHGIDPHEYPVPLRPGRSVVE